MAYVNDITVEMKRRAFWKENDENERLFSCLNPVESFSAWKLRNCDLLASFGYVRTEWSRFKGYIPNVFFWVTPPQFGPKFSVSILISKAQLRNQHNAPLSTGTTYLT